MLGNVFVDTRRDELLHRQFHLPLFSVDGEHQRLHFLAGVQRLAGVVQPPVSHNLADVHQPLDALGNFNERAEAHHFCHGARNLRAGRIAALRLNPRVSERLLQPQRDAFFFRLDGENHRIHAVAGLEQVRWVAHLFCPRHFGNMNEPFEPRLNLDKRAEIHQPRNRA